MAQPAPPLAGQDRPDSPFHDGERAIHRRLGIEEKMEQHGRRAIRNFMPEQHREFFRQLPFVILGSIDASGQPWASMLSGPPGFVQSPDDKTLTIGAELPKGALPAIGLLGIELSTRRRNRANGVITECGPDGFAVSVRESFGNCPKYIQPREVRWTGPAGVAARAEANGLSAADRALIAQSNTLFLATSNGAESADVSHRGGPPGFLHVDGDVLTLPDFTGNFYFNSLGNLMLEPRASLLFIDFDSGDLLTVAVTANIVWDGPDAQRLVRMTVTRTIRLSGGLPLRWSTREIGV